MDGQRSRLLLPLDGSGRFRGHVVDHPIHAFNLIHDASGDRLEDFVGEWDPVGGHSVLRTHGTDRAGVGVGAHVAHHAD